MTSQCINLHIFSYFLIINLPLTCLYFRGRLNNIQLFCPGLKINATKYPKNTAPAIPPAADLTPPMKAPNTPLSCTANFTPLLKLYPNPVKGTVAPAPANLTRGSYIPNAPKITPDTTKITNILAGVSFVRSSKSCPTTQINPPTQNAFK